MIDFRQKRKIKFRKSSRLTRFFSNSLVRFGIAGFLSIFATLLIFILMNYLLGNFDHYALTAAEKLFSLDIVILEKDADGENRRIQPPLSPPDQPELGDTSELPIELLPPELTISEPSIVNESSMTAPPQVTGVETVPTE